MADLIDIDKLKTTLDAFVKVSFSKFFSTSSLRAASGPKMQNKNSTN
ncbi:MULTISPECIES: hypothetical protein [Legionella]|nr:hypothetical protein [Legionella maceachernii]SJZ57516.1 hypothetical protein SAMN02745128_00467 [Legionella maceachernii]SUP00604.1 Uncharacterised protein [Legionella maceachernii]